MTPAPHRYADDGRRRRWGSAGVAVGIHGAVLMLAMLSVSNARPAKVPTIATFNVIEPGPPQPEPAKKPQPRKVPPTPPRPIVVPPPVPLPVVSEMVVALLEQADTQPGGGCDLTNPVQVALQSSAEVQQQLPSIPDSRRSVANTIALWNQQWVEPDEALNPQVLDTIRTTVAATVAAASPECREQQQGGPRLFYLTSPEERTTVLALGSGQWTWQQVADSAQPGFELPDGNTQEVPRIPFDFAKIANSLFAK